MRLFHRHKPDPNPEHVAVPVSTVTRWLMYDTGLQDKNSLSDALSLNPVSDEVDDMERKASDVRLTRIAPIFRTITEYSTIVRGVALAQSETESSDAEHLERSGLVLEGISQASIIGFLSAFMELGLIKANYPGGD